MNLFSSLRSWRAKVRRSLAHRGLWGTLAYGPAFAGHVLSRLRPGHRRWQAEAARIQQAFDQAHQVDTAGITQLTELDVVGQHRDLGHYYHGTDPAVFERMMQALPIDHSAFTFIDFGSGKGKALLLASLWPFRRIVGVEFAQGLHEVAVSNLQRFVHAGQRCRHLVSLHLDATEFDCPPTPLVVYFYNPFSEVVLSAILKKLQVSLATEPREVWVCYCHPYAHGPLDAAPFLGLAAATSQYRIYRTQPHQP
ncbi:MAG: hypothetical protein JWQ88_1238 [Rhodoferax sp.]|nr:hypothetical protein [Rhodoferax sp.]